MNIHYLDKAIIESARDVDDPVGQAIAAVVSSAKILFDMVELGNPKRAKNLDQMAHKKEIDMLCHAMAQIQLAASSADIRRIALGEIAEEDAQ